MRSVINADQFTPFGLWLREHCRDSGNGLSITNLDYVIEDFRAKKIMLFEEKQNGGSLAKAQTLTFEVIDYVLASVVTKRGYQYWGFYTLTFPPKVTMPGPGMKLNGKIITCEQLVAHINFELQFCKPHEFAWRRHTKQSDALKVIGR